jgi:hypothetical protein
VPSHAGTVAAKKNSPPVCTGGLNIQKNTLACINRQRDSVPVKKVLKNQRL